MDEISTAGATIISEVVGGEANLRDIAAGELVEPPASLELLKGGDAQANAGILTRILAGEKGPQRDIVLLNSAAALIVTGSAADWAEGMALASESIDSGSARRVLEGMRATA